MTPWVMNVIASEVPIFPNQCSLKLEYFPCYILQSHRDDDDDDDDDIIIIIIIIMIGCGKN